MLIILFILITTSSINVKCANILGLMGVPSPSHHIWNSALMHKLAEIGHNITILSVDLPKNLNNIPKNVHYIYLEETYNILYNASHNQVDTALDLREFIGINSLSFVMKFYEFTFGTSIGILNSKGLQHLINYPENYKFDLIIYDYTCGSLLLGFLHQFQYPPLIGISAFLNPPSTLDLVGGHYYPGYIPFYSTNYESPMTFVERMHNHLLYMLDTLYRNYVITPKLDELMRTKFPKDLPYLGDLEKHTNLVLVNSHPAINYPESNAPNIIEVGGMQLMEPIQLLPNDIDEFMKNSIKGTILFSLGTNVTPKDIGKVNLQIILDTMSELKEYHFIWKIDSSSIQQKLPKNILIRSFLPQRDILAHPKIRCFVTHAGGLSTQESTWYGVPMVGIPFFADQNRNIGKSVRAGVAVSVDFLTLSVQSLRNAIVTIMENPKYAENMKQRSQRLRDRPINPLDTATWWVEYVLRQPKANHLRSPTQQIGFFAANSIDFILLVLLVVLVISWLLFKIIMLIVGRLVFKNSIKLKTN